MTGEGGDDADRADGDGGSGGPAEDEERGIRTRSVHAGAAPDPATGARTVPIHQTTSYVFEDAETAADLYALDAEGHVYSRISNPTVRTLERRLADLEGGTGAVATASGMAALDAATFLLAEPGDNVVAAADAYGGTTAYLGTVAERRGIEARFVDTLDYDAYAEAVDDRTAYVHVETIANPSLVTPDFEHLADLTDERGIPLLVDNTFATPALCRPVEHGADLVWESTTKWIHGGGTTVGGVLVDGGTFPWDEYPERYPELGAESPTFEGVSFADRFGDRAFAAAARHRAVRSLGSAQSPFDAWTTLQGLETLPLRMDRHCENARVLAEYLADHPDVAWVTHPGFGDHPTHDDATRYLGDYGGMVAFGLAGGYEAGRRFCEVADLPSFLANVGDAKTLVIHPASTTHAQLSEAERRDAGVTDDLLRVSVGIEDPADLLAEFDRAIAEVSS
ncbi:O-acetyl-L-homoserine sulfhydrolase [Halobacteriales archaeon QS_8_69_26]|nr:MAG: O-acetyl-L-homoserine sulfhydrolase [Halobacteriales archaeon QS_8_69_26]